MTAHKFSIAGFIIRWIASLLYITALTTLIPYGALLLTAMPENIALNLGYLPITAFGLLVLSVLVLWFYYKSLAHTVSSLGWMTLLPGLGALFFMIFRPDEVLGLLSGFITSFGRIEPYIIAYLETAFPKLWIMIISYLVLGVLFIYVAGRMEYKHALVFQLKRIFGPRAKIYRR